MQNTQKSSCTSIMDLYPFYHSLLFCILLCIGLARESRYTTLQWSRNLHSSMRLGVDLESIPLNEMQVDFRWIICQSSKSVSVWQNHVSACWQIHYSLARPAQAIPKSRVYWEAFMIDWVWIIHSSIGAFHWTASNYQWRRRQSM